jgi:hypothetical protein
VPNAVRVFLRDFGHDLQLTGGHETPRRFRTDHVFYMRELGIKADSQPAGTQLVTRYFTFSELGDILDVFLKSLGLAHFHLFGGQHECKSPTQPLVCRGVGYAL